MHDDVANFLFFCGILLTAFLWLAHTVVQDAKEADDDDVL